MSDRSEDCPACGHVLSDYRDEEIGRSERLAAAIADHVATWWFAGTVLVLLAGWIVVNVAWQPFEPYPVVTLAVISAVLACVTALQGPLILVTQRRAAERDRMRDREALRVATHRSRHPPGRGEDRRPRGPTRRADRLIVDQIGDPFGPLGMPHRASGAP